MSLASRRDEIVRIIAAAEAAGAVFGVAMVAPDGERFSHNGNRRFIAASTVKIPIMIELFRRIDAGQLSLDMRHRVGAADRTSGSGVAAHLHEGIELTLGDLVYLMMSISDNVTTNILIDRLDMARINATMRAIGMEDSTLGRRMRGQHVAHDEQENWAVPDEYATVITALLADRVASPASCALMLGLLEKQQNDRRLARHLPREDGPRWGSKTGSLPGVVNDVGFIMTPAGPLVLAVFCGAQTDPHAGEQAIGDIARAALDGWT